MTIRFMLPIWCLKISVRFVVAKYYMLNVSLCFFSTNVNTRTNSSEEASIKTIAGLIFNLFSFVFIMIDHDCRMYFINIFTKKIYTKIKNYIMCFFSDVCFRYFSLTLFLLILFKRRWLIGQRTVNLTVNLTTV